MSHHVVQIDNRASSDSWFLNSINARITVACDQQQAGQFSVNLDPGMRTRVACRIKAQPYSYGKQRYDQFSYEIGISETWKVVNDSGKLVMKNITKK